MIGRLFAELRWGTPLAVSPAYRATVRDLAEARAKHRPTRDIQAKRRALVHSALAGAKR